MVVYYKLAGQSIGAHWLSIATLATTAGVAYPFMGGKKQNPQQGPPTNAKDQDEEKYIQDFIKQAEQEEQKEKAKQ